MFDIDRINLQAALSRKLTLEDEARVKIMQKLAEGTVAAVNEAQRYADVLKVIDDGQITTEEVEMLAKKWGMTNSAVLIYLQLLFKGNSELEKMLALLSQIKIPGGGGGGGGGGAIISNDPGEDARDRRDRIAALAKLITPQNLISTGEDARDRRLGLTAMADGGIVTKPTAALIGEAGSEAVIPLDRMGGFGTTVNVNVAGSVISEGQLQSVIQDALYNLNRSGAVTQLTNLGR